MSKLVNKSFTKISLQALPMVRSELLKRLKVLSRETGKKYKIRTFYLGPRFNSGQGQTLKRHAHSAKIGVYEITTRRAPVASRWVVFVEYV